MWTDLYELAKLYEGSGSSYATTTVLAQEFTPESSDDWCYGESSGTACSTIDLSSFAGATGVKVRFVAINANGNNTYLDNILITGSGGAGIELSLIHI